MLFRRSQSGKHIDYEWHRRRYDATTSTFDIDTWSIEDQIRYDLDEEWITGKLNPRSYMIDRPVDMFGANGFDLRDLEYYD